MYGRGEGGTFSIAASDVDAGFWGVAVSTMPIAVGAIVPWAEWKVGAVATQADANYWLGPRGLELLRAGRSAEATLARLLRADARRAHRQVGVVDRKGRAAAWTGAKCMESATHVVGDGFTCQGNIVASDEVVRAMASAFESSRGSLAARMMRALRAGERKGGDRRGIRSAAILIVHREPWFLSSWGNHWIDLRVDMHAHPIRELDRIVRYDEAQTEKFLRSKMARDLRRKAARR
ncbi:MAG TPA: DUF1028 domain-containing protein [Thermoplasmata archaeon]|nr:DUF1028 domain-containing protein [Thermoplasmata archaeon]